MQLKGHPNLRSIMNSILNIWNLEDGSGNVRILQNQNYPDS